MPALTHGRVKNGFNLLPRTIRYAQGKCDNDAVSANQNMEEPTKWQNEAPLCKGSQRALCCGRPLQYTSMMGANLFRNSRIPTGPANRKFASTVSVGRSFAAKRAIARRTANCHPEHGTGGWTATFEVILMTAARGSPLLPIPDLYKRLGSHPLFMDTGGVYPYGEKTMAPNSFIAIADSYKITDARVMLGWPVYTIKMNFKKFYSVPTSASPPSVALSKWGGQPPSGPSIWNLVGTDYYKIVGSTLSVSGSVDLVLEGMVGIPNAPMAPVNFKQRLAGGTKCCCLMPTVTYSQPVNAYRNPCSGGLAKKRLLIPCTNPTSDFDKFKKK